MTATAKVREALAILATIQGVHRFPRAADVERVELLLTEALETMPADPITPELAAAAEYAASQYDIRATTGAAYCVHFGGDGAWHFSHGHDTREQAEACRDGRRAACAARILEHGSTEL